MLEEIHKSLLECADLLPNWKNKNKNELCNLYINYKEANSVKSEYCFAAIVCKYWPKILKLCNSNKNIATIEDCYEWFINGINYALNNHVWLDPNNSLYGDKNGPDKAITICAKTNRLLFLQFSNRDKRKLNHGVESFDSLQSDYGDYIIRSSNPDDIDGALYIKELVKENFNLKQYFYAFAIDGIVNGKVFDSSDKSNKKYIEFSPKRLIKHIHNIDNDYCKIFAALYDYDVEDVIKASKYVSGLSTYLLYQKIDQFILALRYQLTRGGVL